MPILRLPHITRAMLRADPGTLYVFGDNLQRLGYGGQAREMRGEPNAVGVPTKYYAGRREDAYFTDGDLPEVRPSIDAAFDRLAAHLRAGGTVVLPEAGLGTGLAELATRAPAVLAYIEGRVRGLDA